MSGARRVGIVKGVVFYIKTPSRALGGWPALPRRPRGKLQQSSSIDDFSARRQTQSMFRASALALLAAAALPGAAAWGAMGHETVAYIASDFVAAETRTYFQGLLGDGSADYLAAVASWADSYRYTTAGTFSAPFHYIDALDNPPSSCGVDLARDCGPSGCIVSAIANYVSSHKTPLVPLPGEGCVARDRVEGC